MARQCALVRSIAFVHTREPLLGACVMITRTIFMMQ